MMREKRWPSGESDPESSRGIIAQQYSPPLGAGVSEERKPPRVYGFVPGGNHSTMSPRASEARVRQQAVLETAIVRFYLIRLER